HHARGHAASKRVGPAQEINKQYAQFLAAFRTVEEAYVTTLNQPATNLTTVTTTVVAPYPAGSPVMQVANAAVFGPAGTFSPEVVATASIGGIPLGTFSL